MIHYLANRMASVFVLYGESSEESADIYAYACEAIIAFLANVVLSLIVAAMFGRLVEGIMFTLCFVLLRRYTGGYHAKTHLSCILAFSCILAGAMLFLSVTAWLNLGSYLSIWISGLALVGITAFSSIERRLKSSGVVRVLRIKIKGIFLAIGICLICITDFYIFNGQVGVVLSLSMFSVEEIIILLVSAITCYFYFVTVYCASFL